MKAPAYETIVVIDNQAQTQGSNQIQQQSRFIELGLALETRGGMDITQRLDALNFRLRQSLPGYTADWHVAGDPTFITVTQGALKISLRDGMARVFEVGDSFIAQDYLLPETDFDTSLHGHKAEVVGSQVLKAIHIKLKQRIANEGLAD